MAIRYLTEKEGRQFDREDREIQMFGCTVAEIDRMVREAIARGNDQLSVAMSMLSDAQNEMDAGERDDARRTINVAKKIILDVRTALRNGA